MPQPPARETPIRRRDTAKAVSVYLSEDDQKLLASVRMRMNPTNPPSKSAVFLQLLRHGQIHVEMPPQPPEPPTAEALRLLVKLNVNVNQIARRLNAQWRSGTPAEQIGMTKKEFTLIDRGLIVLIAYLRGMDPAQVWGGLGLSEWMNQHATATAAENPAAAYDGLPDADATEGEELDAIPAAPTSDEPPEGPTAPPGDLPPSRA